MQSSWSKESLMECHIVYISSIKTHTTLVKFTICYNCTIINVEKNVLYVLDWKIEIVSIILQCQWEGHWLAP